MINDKKLSRIEKILGKETLSELESLDIVSLKDHIFASELSIKSTLEALEANPQYQTIKEALKAISESLREVKKRQNAIIQYSLHLIEEKGAQ